MQIKPFINKDNIEDLNKNDLKKIQTSWKKLKKSKNKQPFAKDSSQYSARINAKSFSFGIPGLDYENANLGKSINALL